MNWYLKKIIAQGGLAGYLQSLNVSQDIINYLISLENKHLIGYLVNELRQNPILNIGQLEEKKHQYEDKMENRRDPYLPIEKHHSQNAFFSSIPNFSKWLLVNLRKERHGELPTENLQAYDFAYKMREKYPLYNILFSEGQEISDWVRRGNIDITSYTVQEAIDATDEWHKVQAGRGSGLIYGPINAENIIYGPTWKNEKYNGWTLQKVATENDLLTEGNKMNHCAGSYYNGVKAGDLTIYSLRSLSNEPKVTIEVKRNGYVNQIKGNSNAEPADEYKKMLKEFFTNKAKELGIETVVDISAEPEDEYWEDSEKIERTIERLYGSEDTDEYGFKYSIRNSDINSLCDDIVDFFKEEKADRHYHIFISRKPLNLFSGRN